MGEVSGLACEHVARAGFQETLLTERTSRRLSPGGESADGVSVERIFLLFSPALPSRHVA